MSEHEIEKGIFRQTNVKSVPFSATTLSVFIVIFFHFSFSLYTGGGGGQQVYNQELKSLDQELL